MSQARQDKPDSVYIDNIGTMNCLCESFEWELLRKYDKGDNHLYKCEKCGLEAWWISGEIKDYGRYEEVRIANGLLPDPRDVHRPTNYFYNYMRRPSPRSNGD